MPRKKATVYVDVLERTWAGSDLTEDEALEVAYDELDAMRERRAGDS